MDGGRARAHDTCIDQANESDEQAQAHRDRCLQGGGDGTEDRLAEAREDQQEDQDTFPRDDTHGLAVAEACPQDQGEGDDRVEAKACGQGQRIVGNDAHEDRHDARNQRGTGGDALGRNRTIRGDGVAQDSRVDNQDVSHREEGDDSTANLMTNGRAARGNLEERIE